MDGRKATKLDIRFSGSGSLDRTSEDDLALVEAMRLGCEVRLIPTGTIAGKSFRLGTGDEEELSFLHRARGQRRGRRDRLAAARVTAGETRSPTQRYQQRDHYGNEREQGSPVAEDQAGHDEPDQGERDKPNSEHELARHGRESTPWPTRGQNVSKPSHAAMRVRNEGMPQNPAWLTAIVVLRRRPS
jgi:hypothetical protein